MTDINQRLVELEEKLKLLSLKIRDELSRELLTKKATHNQYRFDAGDTAWIMFSSSLVLLLTLPGIALFYGGLASNAKSFLATGLQTGTIVCVVTFLWLIIGYSISFGPNSLFSNSTPIFGDLSRIWLRDLDMNIAHVNSPSIPESVYCLHQLLFAIVAAALIPGSFTDRMKFSRFIIFIAMWHLLVYCPIAHCLWHPSGLLYKNNALDYAGGNSVHIASGITALVSSAIVGKTNGFGKVEAVPHDMRISCIGGALIWVGCLGFNAGSALAANNRAGMALLVTQIAAATSSIAGLLTANIYTRKILLEDMLKSILAGLVAITPAAGYVNPTGAFVIGLVVGPGCYFGRFIKKSLHIDDSFDVFGIHGIGGIIGVLMTGLFARAEICGISGALYGNPDQLRIQLYAILFSIGWSGIGTFIILMVLKYTIGLRAETRYNNIGANKSMSRRQSQASSKSLRVLGVDNTSRVLGIDNSAKLRHLSMTGPGSPPKSSTRTTPFLISKNSNIDSSIQNRFAYSRHN